MTKAFITIIILFVGISNAYTQSISDSLEYIFNKDSINILSTNFNKQLNTFNLGSAFLYDKSIGAFRLNLSENYNSTFIRSAEKSIRDEHFFSLSGIYGITPKLNIGLRVKNNILSDSRKIEINQASQSNLILYSQITPAEKVYFSPFGGYSNNRQIGGNDYGFIYGVEGMINNLSISDFDLFSEFKYKNEDISPRKNLLRYFNFLVTNNFNQLVSNNINVRYLENRKDFYYTADSITSRDFNIVNNIQSRIESGFVLQDRMIYNKFLKIFSLNMLGKVSWRTINRNTRYRTLETASPSIFDTKINELKIEFESTANYSSSIFNGSLKINYSERDEKHLAKNFEGTNTIFFEERSLLESRKNNSAQRASVSIIGSINFSATDKLSFSLYQNKLRYDTPSLENYDDRDEILSIARIRYAKFLTPFFETFINTEGTLNHIVYIFSQKSSDNNLNRTLVLEAGGNYRGKNFSTLNSFSVSANYTVYDFQEISPNIRSFSFRQYTATDSTSIMLNKKLAFVISGYIKLSEQGELTWETFSTKPIRYLKEIYSEPKFVLFNQYVSFAVGARIFSLKTFNYHTDVKKLDSDYLSIGPLTEINILMKNSLYLRLYGWYDFITINNLSKQQVNMALQMNWNF